VKEWRYFRFGNRRGIYEVRDRVNPAGHPSGLISIGPLSAVASESQWVFSGNRYDCEVIPLTGAAQRDE